MSSSSFFGGTSFNGLKFLSSGDENQFGNPNQIQVMNLRFDPWLSPVLTQSSPLADFSVAQNAIANVDTKRFPSTAQIWKITMKSSIKFQDINPGGSPSVFYVGCSAINSPDSSVKQPAGIDFTKGGVSTQQLNDGIVITPFSNEVSPTTLGYPFLQWQQEGGGTAVTDTNFIFPRVEVKIYYTFNNTTAAPS